MNHRCHTLLRQTLMAVHPEEGCALLIGSGLQGDVLNLTTVWPCCNVWGCGNRHKRFLLDPREQLAAQQWARRHDQCVLGVAHSHPAAAAEPSVHDRRWAEPERVMLIVAAAGGIGAWWVQRDRTLTDIT